MVAVALPQPEAPATDAGTAPQDGEEHFDVLTPDGAKTGRSKPRSAVHRDGDWHRAVHVWILCLETSELILQKRALHKDSWAGLLDISCAGHVSAGGEPLSTACRETAEEIGLDLPEEAFEHMFDTVHRSVTNGGAFVNNEHINVYLLSLVTAVDLAAFQLQASEVAALRYIGIDELLERCRRRDPDFVPMEFDEKYAKLFDDMRARAAAHGRAAFHPQDVLNVVLSDTVEARFLKPSVHKRRE